MWKVIPRQMVWIVRRFVNLNIVRVLFSVHIWELRQVAWTNMAAPLTYNPSANQASMYFIFYRNINFKENFIEWFMNKSDNTDINKTFLNIQIQKQWMSALRKKEDNEK